MREAVAIVLMNDGEIYTVDRQNHLPSFPGYSSFPGGLVDLKDRENKGAVAEALSSLEAHLYHAARRELIEELGLDLEGDVPIFRAGLIGEATTPEFNPYRFKTWFIYIELAHRVNFVLDKGEIREGTWRSPRALSERYNRGAMLAVPPTIRLIEALIEPHIWRHTPFLDLNLKYDPASEVPMIEPLKGLYQFMPLSHTLPPASRTNCFIIGDLIIDPSPKDDQEYDKLLNGISGFKLKAIFLTHHHSDHHERAPRLARDLGLPIFLSKDSKERILNKWGQDYFEDVSLRLIDEGEVVTTWLDREVRTYCLPGHDEGQLGLAPSDLMWFLVGDLIQTVGTVVIGGDEGDMTKYMNSLRQVIELGPRTIFPSHGIGMGGVFKLKETLKHREYREAQIKDLLERKMSREQMIEEIYPDLRPELLPYARLTLLAHLKRLDSLK